MEILAMIVLGIGIILFFYFLPKISKKFKAVKILRSKQSVNLKKLTTEPTKSHSDNHNQKQSKKVNIWIWLWLIVTILSFFSIVALVAKISNNKEKPYYSDSTKTQKLVWVVIDTKTITINGFPSKNYYLSSGQGLSIKNATQPYCMTNENGHTVCGEKGEDITPKLPHGDLNMQFRFNTSNGTVGQITLVYWEKRLVTI